MPTTLILAPTKMELRLLAPLLSPWLQHGGGALELCGFGPVAAAARTAQLLAKLQPERVLLIGIAGAIGDRLSVSAAHCFQQVACYGVGAGSGPEFRTAAELGWLHWDEPESAAATPAVLGDVLQLGGAGAIAVDRAGKLITCCSASASLADVELRRRKYPDAIAEDMEGFAVALACQLAGVPLDIIRGIANQAGDRDKRNWKIIEALEEAAKLALGALV